MFRGLDDRFSRSEALLGETAMKRLTEARVLVVGVGGVGRWCAEALVTTGLGHITLVDDDVVAESNVNRQCPATAATVGRPKVAAMAERLIAINPQADVIARFERFEKFEGFDVVILSGSLPKDWPVDTYRVLVDMAKRAGAKVVLDASGKALAEGVRAHPDVIKPNAEECEALVGFVPKTPEDFARATAALKAFCDFPIISDGGAGCWFDGTFVPAPKVEVLDTTAAGDTLLAEWCFSGDVRLAVAAGSAACTMPGGEPPDVELVLKLAEGCA